ncbi:MULTISPECIES: class I SAM-dependent methyltransferase family protein [Methanoculleus]|jgi:tRNA wybutosine-synthesizing protein 2|uniref:Methyltransferase n=1 Tax=Methanoculleus thermophilus TaxID=2200 RepID=A0A1G8YRZ1_9EURY|nr:MULTISPECIES: methyltransferase [Methanoculleus]SDK05619.1 methyltransferase [Methanoculleus thermophilus]
MRARKVPANTLADLAGEEWVDPTRRPYVRDGTAWVPVREGYPADENLPERTRYRGRGYHLVGDIAILHGDAPTKDELAAIVEHCRPRGVIRVKGYTGVMRIPDVEVLYGTAGEVRHREQGYTFILDPTRVMFAQGNRIEKARIASLVRPGERIADMFAGIGYFSIPAAMSGAQVHAMEINPIAFEYLQRNIMANNLADRVTGVLGDCREHLSGIYDRILMGHFDAPSMLADALAHVRSGSVLHVHSIGNATETIQKEVAKAGLEAAVTSRRVKKYGPHAWHMVQDVTIS